MPVGRGLPPVGGPTLGRLLAVRRDIEVTRSCAFNWLTVTGTPHERCGRRQSNVGDIARGLLQVGGLRPNPRHGLSQGDFELALRGLLGEGAPLSPSSIARLRKKWIVEYNAWRTRRLDDRELVYAWADGIVRHEAPENRVGCKDPPTGCRSSPLKLEAA